MQDFAKARAGAPATTLDDNGLPGRTEDTKSPLTKREAEVLHWVSLGKSDWQIGKILGISAKTANYHVEKLKRRFDVTTRTQAVLAAQRRGFIA